MQYHIIISIIKPFLCRNSEQRIFYDFLALSMNAHFIDGKYWQYTFIFLDRAIRNVSDILYFFLFRQFFLAPVSVFTVNI